MKGLVNVDKLGSQQWDKGGGVIKKRTESAEQMCVLAYFSCLLH